MAHNTESPAPIYNLWSIGYDTATGHVLTTGIIPVGFLTWAMASSITVGKLRLFDEG